MRNQTEDSAHLAEAERYLKRPYARMILPESDGTFRGEIVEFPGCIATGDSASTTVSTLEEVARSWLAAALARGQNIPEPIENSNDFSGRLLLRISKSLHKKAAWVAEREGVSLNNFVTTSLSESVGERNSASTNTLRPSLMFVCPSCSQSGLTYSITSINNVFFPGTVGGHIPGKLMGTAGYSGTAGHFSPSTGLTGGYLNTVGLVGSAGSAAIGTGGIASISGGSEPVKL
jgi:predicted HicB family RNase H-like nuclease